MVKQRTKMVFLASLVIAMMCSFGAVASPAVDQGMAELIEELENVNQDATEFYNDITTDKLSQEQESQRKALQAKVNSLFNQCVNLHSDARCSLPLNKLKTLLDFEVDGKLSEIRSKASSDLQEARFLEEKKSRS